MSSQHPFGQLLSQIRSRKLGLSQTRLAELSGYAPAILVRMCQGKKDLTGPSGRERIIRILGTLCDEGVRLTLDEANALLISASLPPLFEGLPVELALMRRLQSRTTQLISRMPRLSSLTSFVGREAEIAELTTLVMRERLVTLTGAGGVGKTRLALKVAAGLAGQPDADAFPDGVWFVELASVENPKRVTVAIADALGMPADEADAVITSAQRRLESKNLLLVLDNCEHVLEACAEWVASVMPQCPRLHVLATSRESLNIAGERVWHVSSLTIPDATHVSPANLLGYEAVRLFVDRATAAQRSFELNNENAASVARICQRLDGIPLAIELVAVQIHGFTTQEIAGRIDAHLSLHAAGHRDAHPRHHTMRSALEWSYQLLMSAQQRLLARLSVFVGGWTLHMAQAVCESTADDLFALVHKSLVLAEPRNAETRYRLLEPVRQHAAEKLAELGEEKSVRDRHMLFFAGFAEQADAGMMGMETGMWEKRVALDYENLRAARAWSMATGDCEAELRLAGSLWRYWILRAATREGQAWIKPALERCDATTASTRARALYGLAYFHRYLRNYRRMTSLAEQALALCRKLDDRNGIAICLVLLAVGAQMEFNDTREVELRRESLEMLQLTGDLEITINALVDAAWSDIDRANFAWAASSLDRLLELGRKVSDLNSIWTGLYWLAHVACHQNYASKAIGYLDQSLRVAREMGVGVFMARSIELWGWIDRAQAMSIGGSELTLRRETGDVMGVAHMLLAMGRMALDTGDFASAHPLLVECVSLWDGLGPAETEWGGPGWADIELGHLARMKGNPDAAIAHYEGSLRRHVQTGVLDGVAAACLHLGWMACLQEDALRAGAWFKKSLTHYRDVGMRSGITLALAGLAEVARLAGDGIRAAQLAGAADSHLRANELSKMRAVDQRDFSRCINAAKALLNDGACADAWTAGHSLSIKSALAWGLA